MKSWKSELSFDPIQILILSKNKALIHHTKKNVLEEKVPPIETLWDLPNALKIIKKQNINGSWIYPGRKENIRTQENYDQIETYRQLGFLIENFGYNRENKSIEKAAEFLFSFQTEEGDFRGIYGNQYTPNYSAGICELLVKAGYKDDPRIINCLQWLLKIRQEDGGWAIPIRTYNYKWGDILNSKETLQPKPEKPFSHMVTGIVLRAFAAHPSYRENKAVKKAANLVINSFFLNDKYPDRKDKSFWTKFSFPFWFTDLLSALDSIFYIDNKNSHPNIKKALRWFKQHQKDNGLWDVKMLKSGVDKDLTFWMSYLISLTFKRFII